MDEYVKQVELQIQKCLVAKDYTANELHNIKGHVEWDQIAEILCIKLERYVATEDLGTEVFQWPLNCWEHFKQDYFPKWLLKKFPVKYEIGNVDVQCWYPEISIPEYSSTIRYHVMEPYMQTPIIEDDNA